MIERASGLDFAGLGGSLCRRLRERANLSRGQLARRIKRPSTSIYYIEKGMTRAELGYFFDLLRIVKVDFGPIFRRHMHSIQGLASTDGAVIVQQFRKRLRCSQAALAKALGYKSAAIVHHFEKGLRQPSLANFLTMLALAEDNLRAIVFELISDAAFAGRFPEGMQAALNGWQEYWSTPYVSGMRQIMRTSYYRAMRRYEPGLFGELLGISLAEERRGLEILRQLDLAYWSNGKPLANLEAKIMIPDGIDQRAIRSFKRRWIDFVASRMVDGDGGEGIASIDLLPASRGFVADSVRKVRDLQDDLHHTQLTEQDGFMVMAWLGCYVGFEKKRARGRRS